MSDANERELTTYGFTKPLRTGLITAIISILLTANVKQYFDNKESDKEKIELQKQLYEKMIEYIRPTRDKMEESIKRVDTAVVKVTETAIATDSLNKSRILTRKGNKQ